MMLPRIFTSCFVLCLGALSLLGCQTPPSQSSVTASAALRLNQVGFLPDGPKVAVLASPTPHERFAVATLDGTVVFEGEWSEQMFSASTEEQVQIADFSTWTTPGTYQIIVETLGASHPFDIRADVYVDVGRVTAKALYFNRASTALPEAYAGPWARPAGHPDTNVRIHPSAATDSRLAGRSIASPGGWYDAGDYNKYIVPAAFTSYFLLAAYEDATALADTLGLNIPESTNALPDLLDEALWNIRWMLTMQDTDGGLYHKLTHANFSGMVMPDAATEPRYVIQKTTAATLTFAAAMAQAARVFAAFEAEVPGLADSSAAATQRAWAWAQAHPDVIYRQDDLNAQYDPDISTGAYGGAMLDDERYWASLELFLLTGDETFYPAMRPEPAVTPSWGNVALLGDWSMVRHTDLGEAAVSHHAIMQQVADEELAVQELSAYRMAVERDSDFYWGATGTAAAKAGVFLQAYRQTGNAAYREAAIHVLDYLLGRNGTTYSFVTGLGERSPQFPHHRPSFADGVDAPIPGWLVGGPGALGIADCDTYPTEDVRALRYIDETCSYSTNEVTTYWNTPLTYAALLLQALP